MTAATRAPRARKKRKQRGYYETGFVPDVEGAIALTPPAPLTEEDHAMFDRIDQERRAVLSAELAAQGAFSGPDRADEILALLPPVRSNWADLERICYGSSKNYKKARKGISYDPD